MSKKIYYYLFTLLILTANNLKSSCQITNITDGRANASCVDCNTIMNQIPKEVNFGINITPDRQIIFSMNDVEWFYKIFKDNTYGVTVDVISKDRYNCTRRNELGDHIPMGFVIPVTYKNQLSKNIVDQNKIEVPIGVLPEKFNPNEVEGNLIIVKNNQICFYTKFLNIDRSTWNLLPMGLFTDSLINTLDLNTLIEGKKIHFTIKKEIEIPFIKGSAAFDIELQKKYFTNINLSNYHIKKADIRVYSSVEGSVKTNNLLMTKRANSVINSLKTYQLNISNYEVITSENWVDFYNDINNSKFAYLDTLSKNEIKKKLMVPEFNSELEPILSKHRKVIITLYLDNKTSFEKINTDALLLTFKSAINKKELAKALLLQKEIANRIEDNKMPIDYIDKIEIPSSKDFSNLLQEKEVYKYYLKLQDLEDLLDNLNKVSKIDPTNGKINYNICATSIRIKESNPSKIDSVSYDLILAKINQLNNQGIQEQLVKRLKVNYHINLCQEYLMQYKYKEKDKALVEIKNIYNNITASDQDIYSMAKFYCFYAQKKWALEIITPRLGNLNVSQDIIFYYLNLSFFYSSEFESEDFKLAVTNAISLNPKRFCNFFNATHNGGASFQLLENVTLQKAFCEVCSK